MHNTSRTLLLVSVALALVGCETPTTQRYSTTPSNWLAAKNLPGGPVRVEPFSGGESASLTCRGVGSVAVADGLSHAEYIRRALEHELQAADKASPAAAIALRGRIEQLEFSSTEGITGGYWALRLRLTSSNGQAITVAERYEFRAGFGGLSACQNVAQAFAPAVQNLIGNAIKHSGFQRLLASP